MSGWVSEVGMGRRKERESGEAGWELRKKEDERGRSERENEDVRE